MKNIIKVLVVLPLVILVIVVVIGALGDKEEGQERLPRPSIGDPARDFTYPGLDGRPVRLSDYYGKKVVFVNIWATWCTECKKELPTVQAMYEKFRGDNFEVLAVSIDALGKNVVVPFMKEFGLKFPALLDTSGSVQLLYGTTRRSSAGSWKNRSPGRSNERENEGSHCLGAAGGFLRLPCVSGHEGRHHVLP
jgi:peroxiredoxin